MAMNDPLGDMIARIHNAQMRNKSKVSIPASKLRVSVLDVLKTEGFIRDYAAVEHSNGRKELEIEHHYNSVDALVERKWRAGDPRDFASIETGTAGLCLGQGAAACQQRIGSRDPLDAQGCDGRSRRP